MQPQVDSHENRDRNLVPAEFLVHVSNNYDRRPKDLFTEQEGGEPIELFEARDDREEAQFVVGRILGAVRGGDRSGGEFAIFYRTNAQSRLFEEELLKYDSPTSSSAACASTTAPR